jgi:peroxiredoxin
MAQLRQGYQKFVDRDAEIVVVGPDGEQAFMDYWRKEELPFVGLADSTHTVAKRYGQEVKLLKLGRMPALLVIDKAGQVAYRHYGSAMSDIPPNPQILAILDELNQSRKSNPRIAPVAENDKPTQTVEDGT